jgi:SAM-dependent methyltransferase
LNTHPTITWNEAGVLRQARWLSESRPSPPAKVMIADDTMKADTAYRNACEGIAMLWKGDYQNARQLLNAMARRVDRKPRKTPKPASSPAEAFHFHRRATANRARVLGMLLIELEPDHSIKLKRAPDVRKAFEETLSIDNGSCVISLRELLGIIGAHEWRKNGIDIPFLNARIHPHFGVFSPVRKEYITLVANAPLPSLALALDIGTGTGVIAAVLAQRGVSKIIATDNDPRAIACARENMMRLGFSNQVEVIPADLFPPVKAPLVVCNPPWVPARPVTIMERGIYDPDSRMLCTFLKNLPQHLEPGGEGWLILSDLAELLGLRTRAELTGAFERAGLHILDKIDIAPSHPRTADTSDPLHAARAMETTSLWRLASLDM